MTVQEAIRSRRSIRKFKPGVSIPDEHIEQILTAGMMAPSACNTRTWSFIVIRNRDKLDAIMQVHPHSSMLKTASAAIITVGHPEIPNGISKDYFPQDCGAATQNMLLQALELGYGTCWCGVYPKEERVTPIKELLNIEGTPFNLIALGVADEAPDARGFFDATKVTYID